MAETPELVESAPEPSLAGFGQSFCGASGRSLRCSKNSSGIPLCDPRWTSTHADYRRCCLAVGSGIAFKLSGSKPDIESE
jgi:hypothetical protein